MKYLNSRLSVTNRTFYPIFFKHYISLVLFYLYGAPGGNRTRANSLGSYCSTIKLRVHKKGPFGPNEFNYALRIFPFKEWTRIEPSWLAANSLAYLSASSCVSNNLIATLPPANLTCHFPEAAWRET